MGWHIDIPSSVKSIRGEIVHFRIRFVDSKDNEMARRSLCWDNVKSQIIELDSSDDDAPKRSVRRKLRKNAKNVLDTSSSSSGQDSPKSRQNRISSSETRKSGDSFVGVDTIFLSSSFSKVRTPPRRKFQIISSDSEDCVVYSDEEPERSVKITQLSLPKFSFDTPDGKVTDTNRKLLSDIINRCGTPLRLPKGTESACRPSQKWKNRARNLTVKRSSTEKASIDEADTEGTCGRKVDFVDLTVESKEHGIDDKRRPSDEVFDSLIGIPKSEKPKSSIIVSRSAMENATETSSITAGSGKFKKPTAFKKQKEISNCIKRPGDSKIIHRRTDDSDSASTDCHVSSSVENLHNLESCFPMPASPPETVWSETTKNPFENDGFAIEASPRPPIRRKKTTSANYRFDDMKSALNELENQSADPRDKNCASFLSSLNDVVAPSNCHPAALIFRDKFAKQKEELAATLYRLFNKNVFDSRLPDDMKLDWSGRMTSSAGITHLSRKITNGSWLYIARITLSKPIVTTAARLRDTLIHEMCHAAVWLLNHQKDGHGSYWKSWTYKARETYPELMAINTCHSYSRAWKFLWECVSCGYTIGRMTKSFDTQRFSCGRCHGKFLLKEKGDKKKREASGFAKFVKENYASVKTSGAPHKEIMKLLSEKYQRSKIDRPSTKNDDDDPEDVVLLSDNVDE